MGIATEPARELYSKIEVLQDLEEKVRELMETHERKRELWFPSDLIGPAAGRMPGRPPGRAAGAGSGIPDPARAALALNLLTEEGLPHFHRLLAVYLGDESFWRSWNNLWTAEEDRHGQVLHDYARDTRLLHQRKLEEMQFEYLRAGFHPEWDRDPYRVFAYTTVQERATQFSHSETGKIVAEYEPRLASILSQVAKEEARHYTFYRTVFEEILKRDPTRRSIPRRSFSQRSTCPASPCPDSRNWPTLSGGRGSTARATTCASCRNRSATGRSRVSKG